MMNKDAVIMSANEKSLSCLSLKCQLWSDQKPFFYKKKINMTNIKIMAAIEYQIVKSYLKSMVSVYFCQVPLRHQMPSESNPECLNPVLLSWF